MVPAELPGAGAHDHVQPAADERRHRAVECVGAEQPAGAVVASLVRVERRLHRVIERVGGVELDATDDREGDQDGAAGSGAGRDEPVHLLGGQHVQQGGRRDQAGARELLRGESGDVAPTGLEGERAGPGRDGRRVRRDQREQLDVPVVQDPVLAAGQPRREPARHRPAAGPEVVDDEVSTAWRGAVEAPRPARPSGPRRRRAPAGSASLRSPAPVRWTMTRLLPARSGAWTTGG